jgi:hypothetical protein
MFKRFVLALALATAIAIPVSVSVDAMNAPAQACGDRGICQPN